MTNTEQLHRLVEAGLAELANIHPSELIAHAIRLPEEPGTMNRTGIRVCS